MAAASPLRLLTPRNLGHAAWVYTSSYGGGLVDGDAIVLDVEVGAGASAFVSTQASTKVADRRGGRQRAAGAGGGGRAAGGHARSVVCFASSRYRQAQQFELGRGAGLDAVDWMSSGRRASGERWVFDDYDARLSVRLDGQLLVHDRLRLCAEDGALAARMGRFEVLAILVIVGGTPRAGGAEERRTIRTARIGRAPGLANRRATSGAPHRSAAGGDALTTAATPSRTPRSGAGCVIRVAGRLRRAGRPHAAATVSTSCRRCWVTTLDAQVVTLKVRHLKELPHWRPSIWKDYLVCT